MATGTSIGFEVRGGNSLTPDGTWSTFTPVAGGGSFSLTSRYLQYRATLGTTNPDATPELASVTLSYGTSSNRAPTASDQALTTAEDTALPVSLGASDPDGDSLTYTVVSSPLHGALTGSAPALTYTPAANYAGPDSFTFRANDGSLDSTWPPCRSPSARSTTRPSCVDGSRSTAEDTALSSAVTCVDVDTASLTHTVVDQPSHGSLSLAADGSPSYTPAANYAGPDSFTFRASDGSLDSTWPPCRSPSAPSTTRRPSPTPAPRPWPRAATLAIALSASDLDADPLAFSAVLTGDLPLPSWIVLTDNGDGSASLTSTPAMPMPAATA